MSELFKAVQNALRNAKENGIDLTTLQGVTIGSKTYPAMNKVLVLDTHPHTQEKHSFEIPLENRHKVQVNYSGEGIGKKAYAYSHVLYPTQTGEWIMNLTSKGWRATHSISEFDQHFPPFDTFHDRLKKYASEKSRGFRVYNNVVDMQEVPDDELQEHYKIGEAAKQRRITNYPLEADEEQIRLPHLIKVYKTQSGASSKKWLYDLKTEQLKELPRKGVS